MQEETTKRKNAFPHGWDEGRVCELIAYYESLSEEEPVAEDEAALQHRDTSLIKVPNEIVPAIQELLAKR